MFFKWIDKIDLSNKFVFFVIVSIVVFVLTYINNYFFYKYVEIRDSQEIRTLAKTIHFKLNNCNDEALCLEETNKILKKLNLFVRVSVVNSINNTTLLQYSNIKKRHLDREIIELPNYLKTINNKYTLSVSKNSTPNIFYTTVTSITFSIYDIVMKVDESNIKETIDWYLNEKIHLRSQHVVIFTIFTYFILSLLKITQSQLIRKLNDQNVKIINLVKDMSCSKENETELTNMIQELKSKQLNLAEKMEKYSSIINPPIDILKYEDILSLDPESIIFKCRKVTEKIITVLYLKNIGSSDFKSLDTMIKDLKYKKVLNKKSLSYANTIKAFGNISAHPDIDNPFIFTQEDAKIISNALILLIEELNNNNFLEV